MTRGWCSAHYQRWRRYGDPSVLQHAVTRGLPLDRFWSKVEKTDTCWLWRGYRDPLGYGRIGLVLNGQRTSRLVHRWAYQQLVRPLQDWEVMDHLCRNPPCVNPAHLEPVTQAENMARGILGAQREAAARRRCSVLDCARGVRVKGMCEMHHRRMKKHGDVTVGKQRRGGCAVDGCTRLHKAHGLCGTHYQQTLRGGLLPTT